jgi:GH35 family endo-1,4-beta-xylanase
MKSNDVKELFNALNLSWIGLFLLVFVGAAQFGFAQGVSLLPVDIYGFDGTSGNARVQPITVSNQSFTQGYRITVNNTSENDWDAGLSWRNTQQVNAGDNLAISFWVRKIAPLDNKNIRGYVGFEQASGNYDKSLYTAFPCDSDVWTKYSIPFKSIGSYAPNAAQIVFHFAHGPQTFEIGGITAVNLGATPIINSPGMPILTGNIHEPASDCGNPVHEGFCYFGEGTTVAANTANRTIQVTTQQNSEFIYAAALGWQTSAAVNQNDMLLLKFRARKLEPSGNSSIVGMVVFERTSDDEKSLAASFPADTAEWVEYRIPFKAQSSLAPGEGRLNFQYAAGPQKFEIADVSLANYGQNINDAQLSPAFYYPGRSDSNADWRNRANARIEQFRKGNVRINVRDGNGNPVSGANVFVQQTEHSFRFGSAVNADRIVDDSADMQLYKSRISSHFSTSVLENDLKWGFWECTNCGNHKQQTSDAIQWLRGKDLAVRGHNVIWAAWDTIPDSDRLRNLPASELRQAIDNRFNDVLTYNGINGQLYQWDVINEPYGAYDVQGRIGGVPNVPQTNGVLGNLEMVRWLQRARQLDPNTKLFVNDYDILEDGGINFKHQNYYFALINWLKNNGAPLDGAGLQAHFGRITPPDLMESIIDRYSQLPVRLGVTEFDFNSTDEQLQADYTRDVMTMIFSQPKFDDFVMWGFWENAHWLPNAAMYRADWSSKPNAIVYNDLLFKEWWTNEKRITDANGSANVRGFKGIYNVTVTVGNQTQTVSATIGDNGEITVTLATPTTGGEITDGVYKITAKHSGKVLDVNGNSTANNATVHQWQYLGQTNQKWRVERQSDGTYKLTAQHSGKVLNARNSGTANGTKIQQYTWNNSCAQKWWLEPRSDGAKTIRSTCSDKVLDVSGVSLENGAPLQLWSSDGDASRNQGFIFERIGN